MANYLTNWLARKPATPVVPRKAAPATSYSATGLIPTPDLNVEGGSAFPVLIPDIVPELISPYTRLLAYTKMMTDAGVDVSVRAAKTPVLGAEYFMEPYSDDPNDILISEFIEDNLFGGMSAPFINTLEDILRMYEDGYSILEKVYEMRTWSPNAKGANSKQYTMLKKLGVRPSSTVKDIAYDDNGGVSLITQSAIRADRSVQDAPLDISKLLVFTFNKKGGDIQGRSVLRTAYMHWYYKTHLYKIDAIQKERHSLGVPKGMLKPGYNESDKNILRTLLRNLRSNEENFLLLTPNVDVEFAEIHGTLVDVLKSAEHHNNMLLLNVMAQFLASGMEGSSGGGRASSGTQADLFMKALRHIANYVADVINMYLIPELVVWNFPTNNFPKLRVRNIGETRDLQMLGSALAGMLHEGGFQMDDPLENYFRTLFDLPMKDPSTLRENVPTPVGASDNAGAATSKTSNGGSKNGSKPGGGGNTDRPVNAPQ